MIASIRKEFNSAFTNELYQQYLSELNKPFPNTLNFRVAETPIFMDPIFTEKILATGKYIAAQIQHPDFKVKTEASLRHQPYTVNETPLPKCILLDFAITKNEKNEMVPALIELQGFPSLFAFELLQDEALNKVFTMPKGFSPYLNGYTREKYLAHLSEIIKGAPGTNIHTVLLELFPHQQKTSIDFYCTEKYFNVPIVCITEIFQEDRHLFYERAGHKIKIERIYNRIVLDELKNQTKAIQDKGALLQTDLDIEWVTHPNHFFRISKFLLPFLTHTYIPNTQFVNQLETIPNNLEDYILKPLFSFAGQGVIIDIQKGDIEKIANPEQWILQDKVHYAECIETPTGPAKAEIRLFYFWDERTNTYVATMNLARLSKGKMIGVDYNKTATWVGGSLAYFEQID